MKMGFIRTSPKSQVRGDMGLFHKANDPRLPSVLFLHPRYAPEVSHVMKFSHVMKSGMIILFPGSSKNR